MLKTPLTTGGHNIKDADGLICPNSIVSDAYNVLDARIDTFVSEIKLAMDLLRTAKGALMHPDNGWKSDVENSALKKINDFLYLREPHSNEDDK